MTETPTPHDGQPPSGLDRIEAILFRMATNLSQVATNQVETDFRLNQVTDKLDATADQFRQLVTQQLATDARLDRVTERLDRVATQQEATDARLDRVVEAISGLTVETDSLRDIVMHFVQLSERDREQASADRAEIRKIWEYLRDRNGGSSTPN